MGSTWLSFEPFRICSSRADLPSIGGGIPSGRLLLLVGGLEEMGRDGCGRGGGGGGGGPPARGGGGPDGGAKLGAGGAGGGIFK